MEELKGKIIDKVYLSFVGDIMSFKISDGSVITYQTENDCCNEVWFETWENLEVLSGSKINNVIELSMREVEPTRQEVEEAYGHRLETNRGYALIEYRNSHNGYYGGSIHVCGYSYSDAELNNENNFKNIFESSRIEKFVDNINNRFELMDFE